MIKPSPNGLHHLRLCAGIYLIVTALVAAFPALSEAADPSRQGHESKASSKASHGPIRLFQKTISKADGNRCPMYPSCSHYSSQAFERHNPITAWILTADRLLRCGRDETRQSKRVYVNGHVKVKDTLRDNTFWWSTP